MLAVEDDDRRLTNFAVRGVIEPMVGAIKEKYYKLHGG
jgi:hypothetical protein